MITSCAAVPTIGWIGVATPAQRKEAEGLEVGTAARMLGISRKTMWQWVTGRGMRDEKPIAQGWQLPSGPWRVSKAWVERELAKRARTAARVLPIRRGTPPDRS